MFVPSKSIVYICGNFDRDEKKAICLPSGLNVGDPLSLPRPKVSLVTTPGESIGVIIRSVPCSLPLA